MKPVPDIRGNNESSADEAKQMMVDHKEQIDRQRNSDSMEPLRGNYFRGRIDVELKRNWASRVFVMFLKDKIDQDNYQNFAESQASGMAVVFLLLIYLVLIGVSTYFSTANGHLPEYPSQAINVLAYIAIILFVIVYVVGIIIAWTKIYESTSTVAQSLSPYVTHLETAYVLLSTTYSSLYVLIRSTQGVCGKLTLYTWFQCNPGSYRGILTQDTLLVSLILPIVFACVFRQVSTILLLLCIIYTKAYTCYIRIHAWHPLNYTNYLTLIPIYIHYIG